MWKKLIVLIILAVFTAGMLSAQNDEDEFDPFADPFGSPAGEEKKPLDDAEESEEPAPELQDDEINADLDDFDSLFADDEITEAEEASNTDLSSELLEDTGVRWSGRFIGNVKAGFIWNDFLDEGIFRKTDTDTFASEIGAVLRFNARPDRNFRVAGKLSIITDPMALGSVLNEDAGPFDPPAITLYQDIISVDELFADFNYKSKLFFRFGKSFIKWGTGYFWSPADILNLSAIDIEDPTAEREGPINLKINYPFGSNNVNLYVLLQDVDAVEETGIALNTEFVAGDFEIGFGGYYQYERKPRIVGTFSGSIGKIGIFGEAALAFGSEKTLLREADLHTSAVPLLETYKKDWKPIFLGTAGAMYINTEHNLTILGQYFFNGEGYSNKEYDNGQSMAEIAAAYVFAGFLEPSDLYNFGQHYFGLSVSFAEIADSGFTLSPYVLLSMSDWSGIAALTISYELFDRAVINLVPRVTFGQTGDEFLLLTAAQAPVFDLTLSFSLGEDKF